MGTTPIVIPLIISIDAEIDDVLYGGFHSHTRQYGGTDGAPFVQMAEGGEWIPVKDWKDGKYEMDAKQLRKLAWQFIHIGQHLAEDAAADAKIISTPDTREYYGG